nr:hypothetical protein [Acidiferrobacterales bacterium]
NELSDVDASQVRSILKFDERLSKRLEQLALVDTLVMSHITENDTTCVYNPLHILTTTSSAYLH